MTTMPQTLRACDYCHAKKIKCDRKDPCEVCRDASTECTRNRIRNPRLASINRANEERLGSLMKRIAQLEDVQRSNTRTVPQKNLEATNSFAHTPPLGENASIDSSLPSETTEITSPSLAPSTTMSLDPKLPLLPLSAAEENHLHGWIDTSEGNADLGFPSDPIFSTVLPYPAILSPPASTEHPDSPPSWKAHIPKQAQSYFRRQLDDSEPGMTSNRGTLLRSGLALAQRTETLALYDAVDEDFRGIPDIYSEAFYPPPELVSLVLNNLGVGSSVVAEIHLSLAGHMSKTTLAQMMASLVDNTVHGQTRLQYLVCINFFVYLVLTALESGDQANTIVRHLGGSRERYLENTLNLLEKISILAQPSISLLQALICGTMLYLDLGRIDKSWTLTSAACRLCTALGAEYLFDMIRLHPNSSRASEVRSCLFYTYTFDKAFAMTMDRPCSFPDTDFDVSIMRPSALETPSQVIITVILELSQVLNDILQEKRTRFKDEDPAQKIARLEEISDKMAPIKTKIDQMSNLDNVMSDTFAAFEQTQLLFMYYSIQLTVYTLVPHSTLPFQMRDNFLDTGRQALKYLKSVQDTVWMHCLRTKAFCTSFTWTTMLFPFLPFFVVLSNSIATESLEDLRLLRDVANGFSVISGDVPGMSKIEEFCKSLVTLCFKSITSSRALEPNPSSSRSSTGQALKRKSPWKPEAEPRLANTGHFANIVGCDWESQLLASHASSSTCDRTMGHAQTPSQTSLINHDVDGTFNFSGFHDGQKTDWRNTMILSERMG